MIDADDLTTAEKFLGTAYARAAANPGFRTYQIDTQALRLLLLLETRDRGTPSVRRFDEIIHAFETNINLLADESHRVFAIRVLENIEPFVAARISVLSTTEKNALVIIFNRLVDILNLQSPEERAYTGADQINASIMRAKMQLLNKA